MTTQAEALNLLLGDRKLFMETLMLIEDKSRNLVPFILNPIQSDMCETSSGKDVYVKPAQVGASSYFICDFLIDCITIPGTTSIIVSYDEFITGRLLRKAKIFYDYLQSRIPSIDKMIHKSTYELVFEKTHSSFYISSARSFAGIRGEPIHNLLLDEFAFWQPGDAERVFAAALQRVAMVAERPTKVRVLSTPNGEDNDFYEVYHAAKEGKDTGQSVFRHHFYRWFDHPEYVIAYDSPFALPGDDVPELDNLIPDEENLVLNFNLTFDQIRWRRYKMAEMSSLRRSGETRVLFSQEYPENDVDCFLTAGDMVYDAELLNDKARNCYPAPIHNLFADIWYPPEEELKYLVAMDAGEGKVSESVATAWHFTEATDESPAIFKHCATMSGFWEQDEFADKAKDFARFYNTALVAPEASLGIVTHLKDYPELYYRTDPVSGVIGRDIGWRTDPKTKPYMITEMNRHLANILTHDIRIISQCRNIRWVQGARGMRALSLGSDDYHDSAAIAMVCRTSLPMERGLVGVAGWPEGWGNR